MDNNLKEEIDKQIEKQTEELERRFNQFLADLEQDFDFVPSAVASNNTKNWDDAYQLDSRLPELDNRLANIEKRYGRVALKYNLTLGLSGLAMFSILGYLVYFFLPH